MVTAIKQIASLSPVMITARSPVEQHGIDSLMLHVGP